MLGPKPPVRRFTDEYVAMLEEAVARHDRGEKLPGNWPIVEERNFTEQCWMITLNGVGAIVNDKEIALLRAGRGKEIMPRPR